MAIKRDTMHHSVPQDFENGQQMQEIFEEPSTTCSWQ